MAMAINRSFFFHFYSIFSLRSILHSQHHHHHHLNTYGMMWSVCQVEIRFADVTCCFFLYLIRSRRRYGLWIYVEFIVLSFLPSIPLSGFTDISVIIIIIVNDWSFCFLFISSFWFRNLLKRRKKNLLNLIITESMRRVKRCVCVCMCNSVPNWI